MKKKQKKGPRPLVRRLAPGVALGADWFPGFSDDLTNWELMLRADGRVVQMVHLLRPGEAPRELELIADIGATATVELLAHAARLGFRDMPSFRASYIDAESRRVVICDAGVEHFVEANGIGSFLRTDERATRFMDLWAAICAIAPHR